MMKNENRLSFIEVMIIAVVLAVGSMRIVPEFIEAREESKTSKLIDGLQMMRAQLALYCVQHGNNRPPTYSMESFERAMTTRIYNNGPYIKKIPVNPYNGLDTVRFDGEPAGAGKAGWRFDTKAGLFHADNSAAYAVF